MKPSPLFLAAMLMLTVSSTHAQERTAGSALESQMSWSVLSSKINSAQSQIQGVDAKVEQAIVCGKLNKLYAPGAAGANSQGCKDVDLNDNPLIAGIINKLNTLTTNVSTSVTYLGKEQICTAQGYVYAPNKSGADSNGCLKPVIGRDCVMDQVLRCGKVGNCVVDARYWISMTNAPYTHTTVPVNWKHGDTYIWHYASTQNDYGGGQCIDGEIKYFSTGN